MQKIFYIPEKDIRPASIFAKFSHQTQPDTYNFFVLWPLSPLSSSSVLVIFNHYLLVTAQKEKKKKLAIVIFGSKLTLYEIVFCGFILPMENLKSYILFATEYS
ncbi:uncharacterized protein A4U43_C04F1850 [Asparagus officinalis]|uniref:Uncharacterized protein n=1 Tax=Asparagus officinalis TaxID=4686 RepID=A0A5P1EXH1_ASPOF|nr:uncharacterized protein A4U43_C04F1850 [Asparagus officinalis]